MLLSITRVVVVLSWAAMLAILTWRHLRLRAPEARRAPASRLGLLLQGMAYAGVFGMHPPGTALLEQWRLDPRLVSVVAMAMAAGGAAVVVWCQRVLGVQWSLTARLVQDHQLIASGPYAYVRHPIYAVMIPMLAATAIAFSTPLVLFVCLALYAVGTRIRLGSEEQLMASWFGDAWTSYCRRVPALVPFLRPSRHS